MSERRGVTIIIHRDGALDSRPIRLPAWLAQTLVVAGIVLAAAIVLGAAVYLPVIRAATRVPGLERQIADLQAQNDKIRELAAALDSAEARYARVRSMLGGDAGSPQVSNPGVPTPSAPAIVAVLKPAGPRPPSAEVPSLWPLDEPGYVTQGEVGAGANSESHPGVDIAVPIGSLVRASAPGTVLDAGVDPEYGEFVLIQHAQEYQTMYGHLSRVLTHDGAAVEPGEVIGLSGNTGRSSAPHLHFEIRLRGTAIDPLTMVKEGNR